jgi:hypothetical protein
MEATTSKESPVCVKVKINKRRNISLVKYLILIFIDENFLVSYKTFMLLLSLKCILLKFLSLGFRNWIAACSSVCPITSFISHSPPTCLIYIRLSKLPPKENTFTLKTATAMFAETLENL